jgi:hypothetical protein
MPHSLDKCNNGLFQKVCPLQRAPIEDFQLMQREENPQCGWDIHQRMKELAGQCMKWSFPAITLLHKRLGIMHRLARLVGTGFT